MWKYPLRMWVGFLVVLLLVLLWVSATYVLIHFVLKYW